MTDDITNQRAIIARATAPGPFVKGPRYNLRAGEAEYDEGGDLCDVLTEDGGAPLYEAVPIADAEFVIAASVLWPAALDEIEQLRRRLAERAFEASMGALPIPMLLWCPLCHTRHIDEGEFATRPHKVHTCQNAMCGLEFKVCESPTVGVWHLPGHRNEATPEPARAVELGAEAREVLTMLAARARERGRTIAFWESVAEDVERLLEPAPGREFCLVVGCEASFLPSDADGAAGWLFRKAAGWRCPTHAAEHGSKLIDDARAKRGGGA